MSKNINYILKQLPLILALNVYSYSLLADPIAAIAVDPTGKVGVGTQNPSTQLDVNGDVNIKGNESLSTTLTVNSPRSFPGKDTPTIRLQNPFEKDNYYLSLYSYSPATSHGGWAFKLRSYWGGNDSILSLDPRGTAGLNGRVGINTIEPQTALHVHGNVTIDGNPSTATSLFINSPTSAGGVNDEAVRFQYPNNDKQDYYLALYPYTAVTNNNGWAFNLHSKEGGNQNLLTLDPQGRGNIYGRIGINTRNPQSALDVNGDVYINSNPSSTTSLTINSPIPYGDENHEVIRFQNPGQEKEYYLSLYPYTPGINLAGWSFRLHSWSGGNLSILTLDPRANQTGSGRVGINTRDPRSALDVNGGQISLRGVNGHYAIFEVNKEDNGFPRLEISLYTKDSKLKSKDTLTKDGWLSSKNLSSQLTKKVADQQKTIESLIKRIELLEKKVKKQSK